jgi:hypothetical protein
MTFQKFLAQLLCDRLRRQRVLVFHDPAHRYQDVLTDMQGKDITVLDCGGDLLEARERAMEAFAELGKDNTLRRQLMLYVPAPKSLQDHERFMDPWSALCAGGAVFPDGAGDDYRELCLQFLPEQAGRIQELFTSGEAPGLDVINSLRSGAAESPVLRDLLGAEGPKDMIIRFLSASGVPLQKLKSNTHWIKDLKDLVQRTLGYKLDGAKEAVADLQSQLWRYLLFSEFVADLPGDLPATLASVPSAKKEHEPFVRSLCSSLRDTGSTQDAYEEAATRVSAELGIEQVCGTIEDFGELDTFSFEERGFLKRFSRELLEGNIETAAGIAAGRQQSFWVQRDASRSAEWQVSDLACRLLIEVAAVAEELKEKWSLDQWIGFYYSRYARVDSLHRCLEQVVCEIAPVTGPLESVITLAREKHRNSADSFARRFQETVATSGWPAPGTPRATDTFERLVEPAWKAGERVAYFMVDAMRYELGLALEAALAGRHRVTMEAVCSVLPSLTPAGMTALLPHASSQMALKVEDGSPVGTMDGKMVEGPRARAAAFTTHIGTDRTLAVNLDDIAEGKLPSDLKGIQVLVVHTVDIDSLGEKNPTYFLGVLPGVLRKIQAAVNRLADAGFHRAVLATDHGFCWMPSAGAGNAIAKPQGEWAAAKARVMLGKGTGNDHSMVLDAHFLGMRCSEPQMAFPKGLATYTAGVTYFHGGLSPQECIIPVLNIVLKGLTPQPNAARVDITLTYRGATSGRVTSLIPTLELSYPASDFFGPATVRLLLTAIDRKKETVGTAGSSKAVDTATGEVELERGKAIKVPLRLREGFEGAFTVIATDPSTGATYNSIKLETDFHH